MIVRNRQTYHIVKAGRPGPKVEDWQVPVDFEVRLPWREVNLTLLTSSQDPGDNLLTFEVHWQEGLKEGSFQSAEYKQVWTDLCQHLAARNPNGFQSDAHLFQPGFFHFFGIDLLNSLPQFLKGDRLSDYLEYLGIAEGHLHWVAQRMKEDPLPAGTIMCPRGDHRVFLTNEGMSAHHPWKDKYLRLLDFARDRPPAQDGPSQVCMFVNFFLQELVAEQTRQTSQTL